MPEKVDLTTCDREPIHIPGSVQPHGCMIVSDESGERVVRASRNAQEFLRLPESPLGRPLADVVSLEAAHTLRNALASSPEPRRPSVLLFHQLTSGGEPMNIAAHRYKGAAIFEFERATDERRSPLELARMLIAKTHALRTVDDLARHVPRYLQAMLEYDRVMMYRFAEDGSGKVIGEARRPHLESFLGQHFPASDIPVQARALYVQNTIRVIADASGPVSPIEPEYDSEGAPLDLSFAHLRSVSPIHLEYLRNMGVGASMSLSIVMAGQLWGLIACHHYAPKPLAMPRRMAAEMYGEFLSLHLTASHHQSRYDATLRARQAFDAMMGELTHHEKVETYLRAHLGAFRNLISADGIGLWMNGVWTSEGAAPAAADIPALVRHVGAENAAGVWSTHAIARSLPSAQVHAREAAGVLAVPLSKTPRDYLFYFRKEQTQTLEWAGDPHKVYSTGPSGDRLTPRTSFAIWKQEVEGQSPPWTEEDRHMAEAARIGLQEVILRHNELMESERAEAEARQRVLNDELNHRVKNILALIKSLVSRPGDGKIGLQQYVDSLKGRIVALSNAHDQVVRTGAGGSLRRLVEAELSPYPEAQIAIVGADMELDARAYSVMALVVHELATNAAKYGALSTPEGRLTLQFAPADGGCDIRWTESGGPSVRKPARSGFGSILLNRSVPFDLGGVADLDFHSDGLIARFSIPARHVLSASAATPPARESESPANARAASLDGKRALLVEDQLIIALDAEEILRGAGIAEVDTAACVKDALSFLDGDAPDIAVLDVNLGAEASIPVARELQRRAIPFVFATGYGESDLIPPELRGAPVVRKPYSAEALHEAVTRALQAGAMPAH